MRSVKAGDLILDFKLHPRTSIDEYSLHFMIQAFNGGAQFPPPVIDKKSKRVVDGFHRVTMYQRKSKTYPVEVIEREYSSEAEIFSDAVKLNSGHGKNLTIVDRCHCVQKGKELGLSVDTLASALSMTVEAVGKLRNSRPGEMKVACRPAGPSGRASRTSIHPKPPISKPSYEPNRMNEARANQVLNFIHQGLDSIGDEFERVGILLSEARSGGYWRVQYKSEKEFDGAINGSIMNIIREANGLQALEGKR